MSGESSEDSSPKAVPDEDLDWMLSDPYGRAWFAEHVGDLRRDASGRLLYRVLAIGFAIGLAAHVGGYLLQSAVTTEPLGLLADLLYALGYALWTGVVVAVVVQLWPETKRRQIERAIDAYEAEQRDRARRDAAAKGLPPGN